MGSRWVAYYNIPNHSQIANLPPEAVVECTVLADKDGLHPEDIGLLPPAAHAALAPHIDRQEMIVDAILDDNPDLARIALASDPMIHDPGHVLPLFDDLLKANQRIMASLDRPASKAGRQQLAAEMASAEIADLNTQPVTGGFGTDDAGFHVDRNTLRELMENDKSRAVLEKHFKSLLKHPQLPQGYDLTLRTIAGYVPFLLTKRKLRRIQRDLDKLNP